MNLLGFIVFGILRSYKQNGILYTDDHISIPEQEKTEIYSYLRGQEYKPITISFSPTPSPTVSNIRV